MKLIRGSEDVQKTSKESSIAQKRIVKNHMEHKGLFCNI